MIEKFLEGNKRFREEDFAKDPEHYGPLASSQHPVVLWIGCSDSRVDPERITGAKAGEIFVQRNIGRARLPHGFRPTLNGSKGGSKLV